MKDLEPTLAALRSRMQVRGARVTDLLQPLVPEDVAVMLRELTDDEVFRFLRRLRREDPDLAGEVLPLLDSHDVRLVLDELPDEDVAELLEELPSDDATWMLELLPDERVETVIGAMEAPESAEVRGRLELPEGAAGRIMSDEYVAVPESWTAGQAIDRLREAGEDVTVVYVYLVDDHHELKGVVSLRRLIRVPPERPLVELTPKDVVAVAIDTDQEEVAEVVEHYDLVCVPVVDAKHRLVGIITHDDIIDVLREEATEDMLHMAGTTVEDVLGGSPWRSARVRMPWLLFCLLGGVVSMKVLHFEETRLGDLFITLALFMPVIVGMGGNVGTQAATIVVRGLATGRIQPHDSLTVLWRELRTAALVGLTYGLALGLAAQLLLREGWLLAAVVSVALLCSMLLASAFGTLLPILFDAVDIDPAVATGPLVTTTIDVTGIFTYLTVAGWLLAG